MTKPENKDGFMSPTLGHLTFEEIIAKILAFISREPEFGYKIIVGTDSQPLREKKADFVTAIILHRIGKGGVYFWQRERKEGMANLYQRIFQEAAFSLELAQKLMDNLQDENDGFAKNLEIHVDIGVNGETRKIIGEVVGMIRGNGFVAKIKPQSWGASTVADKHT